MSANLGCVELSGEYRLYLRGRCKAARQESLHLDKHNKGANHWTEGATNLSERKKSFQHPTLVLSAYRAQFQHPMAFTR